jgi:hypothetical protein
MAIDARWRTGVRGNRLNVSMDVDRHQLEILW